MSTIASLTARSAPKETGTVRGVIIALRLLLVHPFSTIHTSCLQVNWHKQKHFLGPLPAIGLLTCEWDGHHRSKHFSSSSVSNVSCLTDPAAWQQRTGKKWPALASTGTMMDLAARLGACGISLFSNLWTSAARSKSNGSVLLCPFDESAIACSNLATLSRADTFLRFGTLAFPLPAAPTEVVILEWHRTKLSAGIALHPLRIMTIIRLTCDMKESQTRCAQATLSLEPKWLDPVGKKISRTSMNRTLVERKRAEMLFEERTPDGNVYLCIKTFFPSVHVDDSESGQKKQALFGWTLRFLAKVSQNAPPFRALSDPLSGPKNKQNHQTKKLGSTQRSSAGAGHPVMLPMALVMQCRFATRLPCSGCLAHAFDPLECRTTIYSSINFRPPVATTNPQAFLEKSRKT